MQTYTYEEALAASEEYFGGDNLAAKVFVDKYALRNNDGDLVEKTPDQMHRRVAKELARIEKSKFANPMTEDEIFGYLDHFSLISPQGSPLFAIGNPYQYVSCGNCFVANTRVYTTDGVKPIQEIEIGDRVVTGNGSIQRVLQTHQNLLNNRQLYDIKCYRTPTICVTGDHRFLSISQEQISWGEKPKWNTIEYLRAGDYIAIPNKKDNLAYIESLDISLVLPKSPFVFGGKNYWYTVEDLALTMYTKFKGGNRATPSRVHRQVNRFWKINDDFAYFLGLWYGDGCIFSNKTGYTTTSRERFRKIETPLRGISFTFGSHETKIIDFVISYGTNLFGFAPLITDNTQMDGTTQIVWSSTTIATVFNKLFGRYCDGKRIWKEVFKWPNYLIQSLLQGVIDADGCITSYRSGITMVMKNILLVTDIYQLMRIIGYPAGISLCPDGRKRYARLTIGTQSPFIKRSNKQYTDNRIARAEEKYIDKTKSVIYIDGVTFVRIKKKVKNRTTPKYVYTLGIENEHSYCVEGLVAENCFVLDSPLDSYNSILATDEQLIHISRRRGGGGINLSNLRPRGSRTTNAAGSSTGAVSFAHRYSNSMREVGQHGRRGALLEGLNIHHPDILEFIDCKKDRTQVTGANISVQITDEFMQAVKNDTDYELRFPIENPKITKQISAKLVWDKLIDGAWESAEPGVLFWDTVLREGPADQYPKYKSELCNPCCFAVDTEVFVTTNNGKKEIKTITAQDRIWCDYHYAYASTSGYFTAGKHKCFRVTFHNGQSFVVTANHKWGRWDIDKQDIVFIKTQDLVPGTIISTSRDDEVDRASGWTIFDNSNATLTVAFIEDVGLKEVGCIEVEKYHYFTANNVISGNSEITLSPLSSCYLLLINLFSFVENPFTNHSRFKWQEFYRIAKIAQRFIDDILDLEIEAIDRILDKINADPEPRDVKIREIELWETIKENCRNSRRTGTGATGLGDVLAALGLQYGSHKAIDKTDRIYKTLKFAAYESSIEMAEELGAFECFDPTVEKDCPFFKRMWEETIQIGTTQIYGCDLLKRMWNGKGRRNIALLTSAPAGSISILTQTTSGIEPLLFMSYTRRKKGNPGDREFRSDFVDQNGDHWMEFEVEHPKVKTWKEVTGKTDLTESPWYGCLAEDLSYEQRVKTQAVVQKHLCHAVSSTVNLPERVDKQTVSDIYMMAYDLGLKGITVYRQNSRTGVIVQKEKCNQQLAQRPKELPCDVHLTKVQGEDYIVFVGLMNDRPYEVFAGKKNGLVVWNVKNGTIIKKKKDVYSVVLDNDTEITPITVLSSEMEEVVTRLSSLALRLGADMLTIVKQVEKTGEKHGLNSFSRAIARVLKKYIPEGVEDGDSCPNCHVALVRSSGCASCPSCGYSKCL